MLALDDPAEADLRHDFDGVRVVMDQTTADAIRNAGTVTIYCSAFGPKIKLERGCSGS